MSRHLYILFVLVFCINTVYSQNLKPGYGIRDLRLGIDWGEVEWELGFKGKKYSKDAVDERMKYIADKFELDYDYVVEYQHIMWLPVSNIFFKDEKANMIILSSYPEYYKMLCRDINTEEGLRFWQKEEDLKQIYGKGKTFKNFGKEYIYYKDKGIGVEVDNEEIRTICIFNPQMK